MCSNPGRGNLCFLKSVPRSEEKAIHWPSGDQEGLKKPSILPAAACRAGTPVRLRAFRVLISNIQMRSEEKAIHWPSGDQEGLKKPSILPAAACRAGTPVRLRAFRVLISNIQMLVVPLPRVETNAS